MFFWPFSISSRCHCPMQGPQALASTVAPNDSSEAIWPSRSIVARTCSEPGVTISGIRVFSRPAARACSTTSCTREMSSYEEFVQEPISATEILSG